ncbi:hypothetical protein ACFE04_001731 [Oxalis oulophora]
MEVEKMMSLLMLSLLAIATIGEAADDCMTKCMPNCASETGLPPADCKNRCQGECKSNPKAYSPPPAEKKSPPADCMTTCMPNCASETGLPPADCKNRCQGECKSNPKAYSPPPAEKKSPPLDCMGKCMRNCASETGMPVDVCQSTCKNTCKGAPASGGKSTPSPAGKGDCVTKCMPKCASDTTLAPAACQKIFALSLKLLNLVNGRHREGWLQPWRTKSRRAFGRQLAAATKFSVVVMSDHIRLFAFFSEFQIEINLNVSLKLAFHIVLISEVFEYQRTLLIMMPM